MYKSSFPISRPKTHDFPHKPRLSTQKVDFRRKTRYLNFVVKLDFETKNLLFFVNGALRSLPGVIWYMFRFKRSYRRSFMDALIFSKIDFLIFDKKSSIFYTKQDFTTKNGFQTQNELFKILTQNLVFKQKRWDFLQTAL